MLVKFCTRHRNYTIIFCASYLDFSSIMCMSLVNELFLYIRRIIYLSKDACHPAWLCWIKIERKMKTNHQTLPDSFKIRTVIYRSDTSLSQTMEGFIWKLRCRYLKCVCDLILVRWALCMWRQTLSVYQTKVCILLTHCGIMTPYGDIGLSQHWSRWGLLADSPKPLDEPTLTYHHRTKCHKISSCKMSLKNTLVTLLPHRPMS